MNYENHEKLFTLFILFTFIFIKIHWITWNSELQRERGRKGERNRGEREKEKTERGIFKFLITPQRTAVAGLSHVNTRIRNFTSVSSVGSMRSLCHPHSILQDAKIQHASRNSYVSALWDDFFLKCLFSKTEWEKDRQGGRETETHRESSHVLSAASFSKTQAKPTQSREQELWPGLPQQCRLQPDYLSHHLLPSRSRVVVWKEEVRLDPLQS